MLHLFVACGFLFNLFYRGKIMDTEEARKTTVESFLRLRHVTDFIVWMVSYFLGICSNTTSIFSFICCYALKSHLLIVRKRLFFETENNCRSWLSLVPWCGSTANPCWNMMRCLIHALSFDVTLFVSRYWRLHEMEQLDFFLFFVLFVFKS